MRTLKSVKRLDIVALEIAQWDAPPPPRRCVVYKTVLKELAARLLQAYGCGAKLLTRVNQNDDSAQFCVCFVC